MLDEALECSAVGTREDVTQAMADFVARTGVDEVIVASQIFDSAARKRSIEVAAEAAGSLKDGARHAA